MFDLNSPAPSSDAFLPAAAAARPAPSSDTFLPAAAAARPAPSSDAFLPAAAADPHGLLCCAALIMEDSLLCSTPLAPVEMRMPYDKDALSNMVCVLTCVCVHVYVRARFWRKRDSPNGSCACSVQAATHPLCWRPCLLPQLLVLGRCGLASRAPSPASEPHCCAASRAGVARGGPGPHRQMRAFGGQLRWRCCWAIHSWACWSETRSWSGWRRGSGGTCLRKVWGAVLCRLPPRCAPIESTHQLCNAHAPTLQHACSHPQHCVHVPALWRSRKPH